MENIYVLNDVLPKAFALLPPKMETNEAKVMLLSIGLQESLLKHRYQIVQGKPGAKGPARGLWQFEKGGGVRGVLTHKASAALAKEIQAKLGHGVGVDAAYEALEKDDVFAAAFARLLLYTDPYNLPELGQAQRGWNLYERVWRPGRPHRDKWDANYQMSLDLVQK